MVIKYQMDASEDFVDATLLSSAPSTAETVHQNHAFLIDNFVDLL